LGQILHVGTWFSPQSGAHGGASLNNKGQVALTVHVVAGEERIVLLTPTATTRQQAVNLRSLNRLKQLGEALSRYWQDHDERFPPMKSVVAARHALLAYVAEGSAFVHPETKQPYLPNPALSHLPLAALAKPWRTVAFYEARAAADGTRGVLFADGRAGRVPAAEWRQLLQTMGRL
jgi:hypothetical protein